MKTRSLCEKVDFSAEMLCCGDEIVNYLTVHPKTKEAAKIINELVKSFARTYNIDSDVLNNF